MPKLAQARRFSGSTGLFASFIAFIRSCWKRKRGWPLGISFYNRAVNYLDLWFSQLNADVPSLEFLFVGLKNSGKTAAMKLTLLVMLAQQAFSAKGKMEFIRFIVDSRKIGVGDDALVAAEWANLVKLTGCKVLNVEEMLFEIFDPRFNDAERFIIAIDVAEHLKKAPLTIHERLAIRIILHVIRTKYENVLSSGAFERVARTMTLEEILSYDERLDTLLKKRWSKQLSESLLVKGNLDELLARKSTIDYTEVLKACGDISIIFKLLIDGEYGQMFAGDQYLSDVLRERAVMFDMGSMTDDQIALLEILRFRVMGFALKHGDMSVIPHFIVREEIQEAGKFLVLLRAWAFWTSTARSRRVCTFSSTQIIGNIVMGEEGSLTRYYADIILSGFDVYVVMTQDASEQNREMLRTIVGLSNPIIDECVDLETGCAIVKMRNAAPFDNQFLTNEVANQVIGSRFAQELMVQERQFLPDIPRVAAALAAARENRERVGV